MRIYVASLAAYHAGIMHGTWIDLEGKDMEDVQQEIDAMMATCPEHGEEYAIHDYAGFGPLWVGDYDSIPELVALAEKVKNHGPAFLAYVDNIGEQDENGFLNTYLGQWGNVEDYAWECLDSYGVFNNCDDTLRRYFDIEAYCRDLEMGDIWTAHAPDGGVYIFTNA